MHANAPVFLGCSLMVLDSASYLPYTLSTLHIQLNHQVQVRGADIFHGLLKTMMSRSSLSTNQKTGDGATTAREVYDVTGDASTALQLLSDNDSESPSQVYNRSLLQAMISGNPDVWTELQNLESPILQQSTTARRRRCEEWTLTYNRGLLLLAHGQANVAMATVWKNFQPIVSEASKKLPPELLSIACRMALLLLEGIITLSVGNPMGVCKDWVWPDPNDASMSLPALNLEDFLLWISKTVEQITTTDQHQLKFALSLYTARLDFLQREQGKLVDARIRSARKELKQAMEIFQHKLKSADAASTASGSARSEIAGNSTTVTMTSHNNEVPLPPFLQRQNQAALNLKANTEQLKGNIKKSLILCGEAQTANDNSGSYDAMHYNNLAIVYETHGKPHLAVHAWSKAVSTSSKSMLDNDGTVHLDVTCKILYNAAIGSLQARNFWAAYECLGICLENSDIWRQRARAWLRLGEACIGIWATLQKQRIESQQRNGNTTSIDGFSAIHIRG